MIENRKKAVALRYNQEKSNALAIAATGKGLIADEIIKKVQENAVPILEDHTLIELLAELNINETIPEELYQVAEVFAFIYQTDKGLGISKK